MNSVLKEAVGLLMLFYLCSPTLHSQTFNPKFQFGAGAGTLIYQGDLTPSAVGSYRTARPVINILAAKFLNRFFSVRGNLALGGLNGDDSKYDKPEYRQQRNFNFRSPLIEASVLGEWNILGRNYIARGFAPYIFGGIGYSFLNIQRDWSRLNAEYFSAESTLMSGLAEDAQHSLPRGLVVLPVGLGARYYLSDKFGISAESSYRIQSSDYLDGFSRAANPSRKDSYYTHSIGIVYRVGKKNTLDCPVVP